MAKKKQSLRRSKRRARRKTRKKIAPAKKVGFLGWLLFWPYHLVARIVQSWPGFLRKPAKALAVCCQLGVVGFVVMVVFYGVRSLPYDLSEVRSMPERTTVLDRSGKEIARLHGENRSIVPLSQVAPVFEDALLAREDSRFRSHLGVDPIGIVRSIIENIKRRRFAQGSSTITMQLARNTFDLQSETLKSLKVPTIGIELDRKFSEIAVTFRIEAKYSKDEILEAYMNRIFWGHSYRGVEAASQNYFGKAAANLTLSEAAMLAGIIRGPNAFTPHRYPERARRERDSTLDSMVRENFLSPEAAEKAKKEPLKIQSTPKVRNGWSLNIIRHELEDILSRKNMKRGGLVVKTTLDSTLQKIAESALESQLRSIEGRSGYSHPTRSSWQNNSSQAPNYLQGAIVILDTKTGAVRTVIGGRDVSESSYNRAQWSRRSAGSLFKPFVYLAAYEEGMLPNTWVADTPIRSSEARGVAPEWPANADGKYYKNIRTADALVGSRNASSVRVGLFAGAEKVIDVARSAGLLKKANPDPTLFLGSSAATPWELAQAYTTFPNQGSRVLAHLIESIEDSDGTLLYKSKPLKAIVAGVETAGLVNNLLMEVTQRGTAKSLRSRYGFRQFSAGKTGTTNDYHDAWYAGYTSSLTACVWVGLDSPQKIIDRGYGGSLAMPIWANIFKKAAALREVNGVARYPAEDLDAKLVFQQVRLCRHSGKRVTSGCEAAGVAYDDLVPEGLLTARNEFCSVHPLRAVPAPNSARRSSPRSAPVPRRALPAPEEQQHLRALPVE